MLPAACLSALLCPLLVWPFAAPLDVRTHDLLKLCPFGTTQFGLGLVFLTVGGQMVSATENALINTLETPLAVAWVWVCFSRGIIANFTGHDPHGGSRWARLAQQSVKVCEGSLGPIRLRSRTSAKAASQWHGTIFSLRRSGRSCGIRQRSGCLLGNGEDRPRSTRSFVESTVKRRSVSPRKPRRLAVTHVKVKFGQHGTRRSVL